MGGSGFANEGDVVSTYRDELDVKHESDFERHRALRRNLREGDPEDA